MEAARVIKENMAKIRLKMFGGRDINEKERVNIRDDSTDQTVTGGSELEVAIKRHDLESLKELLSIQEENFPADSKTFNLLRLCLEERFADGFLALFDNVTLDYRSKSCKLDDLLHYAAKLENDRPLEVLLQFRVDVCTVNENNETPLHVAVKNSNRHVLNVLLKAMMQKKTSELENITDKDGLSLFHVICTSKYTHYVTEFLDSARVSINDRVSSTSKFCPGYSALHFAAAFCRPDTVENLLKRGAHSNAKTTEGMSALHVLCKLTDVKWMFYEALSDDSPLKEAVRNKYYKNFTSLWKQLECTLFLLSDYCKMDALDNHGNTALMYAVNASFDFHRDDHFTEKLYSSRDRLKLDQNRWMLCRQRRIVLFIAILHRYSIIGLPKRHQDLLIDQFVNFENKFGLTCMLCAASCKNSKLTDQLLRLGGNVNVYTEQFVSPLHLMAINRIRLYLLDMTLTLVVNVDAQDDFGNTPMHYCSMYEEGAVSHKNVRHLLACGADANIENEKGETVLSRLCSYISNFTARDDFPAQVDSFEELVHDFGHHRLDRFSCKPMILIVAVWRNLTKLQMCGRYDDAANGDFLKKLTDKIHVKENSVRLRAMFVSYCREELDELKKKRVNAYVSLYNVLSDDINRVASYTNLKQLKAILEDEEFSENFENYETMVKSRYTRAAARYELLGDAMHALQNLMPVKMPESCLDRILSYTTEKKLRDLIDANKLIEDESGVESNEGSADDDEPSAKIARKSFN